jgi:hypothetical protein
VRRAAGGAEQGRIPSATRWSAAATSRGSSPRRRRPGRAARRCRPRGGEGAAQLVGRWPERGEQDVGGVDPRMPRRRATPARREQRPRPPRRGPLPPIRPHHQRPR